MTPSERLGAGEPHPPAQPRHVLDLEREERRRVVLLAIARSLLVTTALLSLFYAIDFDWPPIAQVGGVAAVAMAFLSGVAVRQLRSVAKAELPEIRAFEVLASSSVLMVVLFASLYLSLSNDDPGAFSESLNHTGALYFTLTTLTTVGFGDIAAHTDAVRVAVMVQMVANFVVLGAFIKIITGVARKRIADADQ
jgi:hypothetical protein